MSAHILFSAIYTALVLICDLIVLMHPHNKIRTLFPVFISLSFFFSLTLYFNSTVFLFMGIVVSSLILVHSSHKIHEFLYVPIAYLISFICIYCIIYLITLIHPISVTYINNNYPILLANMPPLIGTSCLTCYIIRKKFLKYIINIFDKISTTAKGLIIIMALLCPMMFYIMISLFDDIVMTHIQVLKIVLLLIAFFVLTACLVFVILDIFRKNYSIQSRLEHLETLREYTENLETVYNNLRSFKHDYVNVMTTLSLYIKEKKYDELEVFFNEHILPMGKSISQTNVSLANLSRIKVLEIKSVIYTKLLQAIDKKIDVTVDIPDEITEINMDPVDMARIIGIYLDNAIEACLETGEPKLNLHLGKPDNDTVLIVSNPYIDKGLSISKMQQKDVSTKGKDRGLGLYNVSEILKHYDNVFHETVAENGIFTQQVQIS